jgi:deoxyadenosine/deoxycytidine kinase
MNFLISKIESEEFKKIVRDLYEQNKQWVYHLASAVFFLANRNWKQFFSKNLSASGVTNRETLLDFVYLGSNILWNMRSIEIKDKKNDT